MSEAMALPPPGRERERHFTRWMHATRAVNRLTELRTKMDHIRGELEKAIARTTDPETARHLRQVVDQTVTAAEKAAAEVAAHLNELKAIAETEAREAARLHGLKGGRK